MGKGKHSRSRSRDRTRKEKVPEKKSRSRERTKPKTSGFAAVDRTSKWGVAPQPKQGSSDDYLREMYNNPKTSATP